jgi:signal transduction histidine kinase
MRLRLIHIVLWVGLLLTSAGVHAQERLQINTPNDVNVESLVPHIKVYQTPKKISPFEAYNKLQYSEEAKKMTKTTFGYSTNYFWLYLNTVNLTSEHLSPYLVIANPMLDSVKIWLKKPSGDLHLYAQAGDGLPFGVRQIPNPKIVFEIPLSPNQGEEIVICVNKRHSSVAIPIKMQSQQSFWEEEKSDLAFYGIYYGCLLAITCYVIILFARTRLYVFMWYTIYLIFIGLYLLTEIGLTIQFITTNIPQVNNYLKPVTISIATVALLQFIVLFLNTPRYYPKLADWYNRLCATLLIITIYWTITPQWLHFQTVIFLTLQNTLIFISLVMVIVTTIMTYKKDKQIVAFFTLAFISVLLAGLSIIIMEFGWLKKGFFTMNPLFVGSLIEVVMLAAGLSIWYRNLRNEHRELSTNLIALKEDVSTSFLKGIEIEKQKISFELHDNIGSRLSTLTRVVDQKHGGDSDFSSQLRNLTQVARTLSHQLAPLPFTTVSFNENLTQMTNTFRPHINTNLQVFLDDRPLGNIQEDVVKITRETLSHLYDISSAFDVDVQFFVHPHEAVLSIDAEDLEIKSAQNPQYLKQTLGARVNHLKGTLDFDLSPETGLNILITIPLKAAE